VFAYASQLSHAAPAPRSRHHHEVDPLDKRAQIVDRQPGLALTFNEFPDHYDARPAYPREVFDLLVEHAALRSGTAVLEIGPGTGQATIPMLALGAHVTAVEPGAKLAQRLTARTKGEDVEVIVSTFEEAALPDTAFDMVAAATAYHWVDPTIGATKCARVLRDRGWLALWWTLWGDHHRPDPFHDALQPILREKAPHLIGEHSSSQAYERDIAARVAHVDATGAFEPASETSLAWDATHDPVAIRSLFATFSQWIELAEPLRSELLDDVARLARDDFGGSVRRPYRTILYLSQRRPR